MNALDWKVDVVQQLMVVRYGGARREEDHNLLVPVLLQEGKEEEKSFVRGTHHIALFESLHGRHLLPNASILGNSNLLNQICSTPFCRLTINHFDLPLDLPSVPLLRAPQLLPSWPLQKRGHFDASSEGAAQFGAFHARNRRRRCGPEE